MTSSPQARSLGPHVVGSRVVVRRMLPGETGPSGGPAMTDVLGTCLAWGDGVCVLRPDHGLEPVTIPITDIVSGKPVPPRPSPRHRIPAREAQVRAFALFPDLVVEPVSGPSGWLLRSSATASARRANSVLAFPGGGGYGVAEVASVLAHYAGRDKPAVAAVLGDSEEGAFLRGLGWVPESHGADTLFEAASVASVRRGLRDVDLSRVELATDGELATATVPGRARGVAAYADDWVGFRGIEVEPGHRRQGLGRTIMAALLGWGAERGAVTAYLQVRSDNASALSLYRSMGFRTHHAYAYLTPGRNPGGSRGAVASRGSAPTDE